MLATGGTIGMAGATGGPASPLLDGSALVAAVPTLAGRRDLDVRTITNRPSPHLSSAEALEIARQGAGVAGTGRGVVITHGTDTLEEVAYLCDLLYGGEAPIVFTGAMRPASAPGADGPANLIDALTVATTASAAGLGVLVVFAGEVHAARAARKTDSTALAAFQSPQVGQLGRVAERRVVLDTRLERHAPIEVRHMDARVDVISAGLGSDGRLVEAALQAGADGIVAVALGAGHFPPRLMPALVEAATRVPVVATVRPKRGSILRDTYDYAGSERDLRAGGIVPAGGLSSAGARIKLMACLGAGHGRDELSAAFAPDDV